MSDQPPASTRQFAQSQRKACCLDCGKDYTDFPLDVILPRPQWLLIHPAEGGLLCAACIVKRAAKIPRATCCHLIIEIAPPVETPEKQGDLDRGSNVLSERINTTSTD